MEDATKVSWWSKVDWLKAISDAVITVAGPLGAPLQFLLDLRSDLKPKANEAAVRVLEKQADIADFLNVVASDSAIDDPMVPKMLELGMRLNLETTPLAAGELSTDQVQKHLVELLKKLGVRIRNAQYRAQLIDKLAYYFNDPRDIEMLVDYSGIDRRGINFTNSPEQIWFKVLKDQEGNPPIRLLLLIYEAHKRKPVEPIFRLWLS